MSKRKTATKKSEKEEDPRIGFRSDQETVLAVNEVAKAIDRDATYVLRGFVAYGLEKWGKKPNDFASWVLSRRRKGSN